MLFVCQRTVCKICICIVGLGVCGGVSGLRVCACFVNYYVFLWWQTPFPPVINEHHLASSASLLKNPPDVIVDQVCVLLINHNILVTTHNCCSSDADSNSRAVFGSVFKPLRQRCGTGCDCCGVMLCWLLLLSFLCTRD